MTRLYIIRHGDALPLGGEARRDSDRPLTQRGEKDVRLAGSFLVDLDRDLHRVYCSPLLRARQTAGLIAEAIGGTAEVRPTENLAPGFRPVLLMEELRGGGSVESVAVVGHQPDLSVFLAYLIECEAAFNTALLVIRGFENRFLHPAGFSERPAQEHFVSVCNPCHTITRILPGFRQKRTNLLQ